MRHFEDHYHNNLDIIIDYDDQCDLYYGSVRDPNLRDEYVYSADSNEYLLALVSCYAFADSYISGQSIASH